MRTQTTPTPRPPTDGSIAGEAAGMASRESIMTRRSRPRLTRGSLVALLAAWLLTGCAARVPPRFDPQPPRLVPGDLQFDDHSAKDEIVVLVFGDSDSGSNDQRVVGRRMAEVCEIARCALP